MTPSPSGKRRKRRLSRSKRNIARRRRYLRDTIRLRILERIASDPEFARRFFEPINN